MDTSANGSSATTSQPYAPTAKVKPPLNVFISYKQRDFRAAKGIGEQLAKVGGSSNVDVFVAGDDRVLKAATEWRPVILNKLRAAHVLIFLYSDSSLHWDWCLYETGYFDGRQDPAEVNRRLYLLHRWDVEPVGPFLGLTTVPIGSAADPGEGKLKSMLKTLFVDSTDPPVNKNWDLGGCEELVRVFKEPFDGTMPPPREYVRRRTFRLAKGRATEETLGGGHVPSDAVVSGSKHSFRLFGLDTEVEKHWSELESRWREKVPAPPKGMADPVHLWISNVASKMLAAIQGEYFDDGLPLFYCPFTGAEEKALFRPSLAEMTQVRVHSIGQEDAEAYEFAVVFVDLPVEMSSVSAGPLSTVGSLLRLSHMFRFGWIEPIAADIVAAAPNTIPQIVREMERRLNSITAESFNQGVRTETGVLVSFKDGSPLRAQAQEAMTLWKEKVNPALKTAGEKGSVEGLLDGLREASKVNWQFHSACASRYAELVGEYWNAGKGPLDRV